MPNGRHSWSKAIPKGAQADRNAAFIPENFRDIYYCGTPEEVQALKDIAQKYGLHLLEKEYGCTYDYEAGVLLQSLHCRGHAGRCGRNCRHLHGLFLLTMEALHAYGADRGPSPQTLLAELTCAPKRTACNPYTALGGPFGAAEWNYVTRDGQTRLLLVLDGEHAPILRTGKRHLSISTRLPTAWRGKYPAGNGAGGAGKKLQSALTIPLPPAAGSAEVTKFFVQAEADYRPSGERPGRPSIPAAMGIMSPSASGTPAHPMIGTPCSIPCGI